MLITRIVDERMITLQRQGIITFALSSLAKKLALLPAQLLWNWSIGCILNIVKRE